MMLEDLCTVLDHLPADASAAEYARAIVEDNILGKATRVTRALSLRHLSVLYGLDLGNPLFRMMRRLWGGSSEGQPLLALLVALARDPLLRASSPFVVRLPIGAVVDREAFEHVLALAFPNRFSPASLRSFAQNVGGTWTEAGFLVGRRRKVRTLPAVTPEVAAMSMWLGHLEGRSGAALFSSPWATLLPSAGDVLEGHVINAAHKGLLVYMKAGGVVELRFPGLLTPAEDALRQEAAHVI
jgi:hypothetical protein